MPEKAAIETLPTARVLVFHVDDGKFCVHLDWVEAIYPRKEVVLHTLKAADGSSQPFLIHRGQPAWVVDLRRAFGLESIVEPVTRAAFAVIRSGSALVALQVDECVGVRDMDFSHSLPVPAAVLRDGGNPAGHLVEIDGQLHVVLEPNRILSAELRDALDPLLPEALAFRDRQQRLERLIPELKQHPTVAQVKAFARLARRNGQTRAAKAAQLVWKAMEQATNGDGVAEGALGVGTLLRQLLTLATTGESGIVEVKGAAVPARLVVRHGRLVDAVYGGERGKPAVKEILALKDGEYEFRKETIEDSPPRMQEATAWILIEAIQQLAEERRFKHLQDAQGA